MLNKFDEKCLKQYEFVTQRFDICKIFKIQKMKIKLKVNMKN